MRKLQTTISLLAFAAAAATMVGCVTGAEEPESEASIAEAAEAQYGGCPWGSQYVVEAGMCISTPFRIDRSPYAYGCRRGAVVSGLGNIICIVRPRFGPYYPPYYPPYQPPVYQPPVYAPAPRR